MIQVNASTHFAPGVVNVGDPVVVNGVMAVVNALPDNRYYEIEVNQDGNVFNVDWDNVQVVMDVDLRITDSFIRRCQSKRGHYYNDPCKDAWILTGALIPSWITFTVHNDARDRQSLIYPETWRVSDHQTGFRVTSACESIEMAIFTLLRRIARGEITRERYNQGLKMFGKYHSHVAYQ